MAKFNVEIKRSAAKEIAKLPRKDILVVLKGIESLAEDPRPFGCQKLSGQEKYRLRCGDYRILYSVEEKILTVLVVKVGHRKEVYRNL